MKYFKKEAGIKAELYKILKPGRLDATNIKTIDDSLAALRAARANAAKVDSLTAKGYTPKEIYTAMGTMGDHSLSPTFSVLSHDLGPAEKLRALLGKSNTNELHTLSTYLKGLTRSPKVRDETVGLSKDMTGIIANALDAPASKVIPFVNTMENPVVRRMAIDPALRTIGDVGGKAIIKRNMDDLVNDPLIASLIAKATSRG